ncbi:hypothetical protein NUW58_g9796 [Xylaria curta]|uniref:Uncharacterized protein n=1 Tax=Xylaria curta TaxID=42375 RepID=A0ACC1MSW3_9PEZI|nr:hypothetical protein NUW58_g9796 [Xylaria curta]
MIAKELDALGLAKGLESLIHDPSFDPETLDYSTRRRLNEAARKLSLATEAPGDTVHRIAHTVHYKTNFLGSAVYLIYGPFQLPLALIGVETGLFDILSALKGGAATNAELAEKTGVDPTLSSMTSISVVKCGLEVASNKTDAGGVGRLLRYYQSFGMVSQPCDDRFSANNITRALVSLGGRSALPFISSTIAPAINAMPQFLRENGYANMTDPTLLPWHQAQNTEDPIFKWISERPEILDSFIGWMAGQRDGLPTFLDAIDFDKEFARGAGESTPVFVDVGGSISRRPSRK